MNAAADDAGERIAAVAGASMLYSHRPTRGATGTPFAGVRHLRQFAWKRVALELSANQKQHVPVDLPWRPLLEARQPDRSITGFVIALRTPDW